MEIKRMYALPENRGKGMATKVFAELEKWAVSFLIRNAYLKQVKNNQRRLLYIKRTDTKLFQTKANTQEYKTVFALKRKFQDKGRLNTKISKTFLALFQLSDLRFN